MKLPDILMHGRYENQNPSPFVLQLFTEQYMIEYDSGSITPRQNFKAQRNIISWQVCFGFKVQMISFFLSLKIRCSKYFLDTQCEIFD